MFLILVPLPARHWGWEIRGVEPPAAVRRLGDIAMSKRNHAMRTATMAAYCLLTTAPLVSPGTPARADNNDFMGQAQRFFTNKGDDRDAYDRGRVDEMRHQQAEQDRYRYRRDRDLDRGDLNRGDWDRESRASERDYRFSNDR
jgi:hypothetical protein